VGFPSFYFFEKADSKLRQHKNEVVIFDPQLQQLVPRQLDITECPTCHRPLEEQVRGASQEHGTPSPRATPGYVHPQYFRILYESIYGSPESSAPPSPRRRLVQPVGNQGYSTPNPRQTSYASSPPASPPSPNGISTEAFSPGYFERCYVVNKELGRGGKGVVLLVTHMLDGNIMGQFACKRVPVGDDREWLKTVLDEVHLLYNLEQEHLVRYHHVWLEDVKISNFGPSVPCAFILQQYCNSGDLHQYVFQQSNLTISPDQLKERVRRRSKNQHEPPNDLRSRKLSFDEIKSFFNDITLGLNHLHVNGYIHRDLKPSNCLLHNDGSGDRPRVLVSDFGEVQVVDMVRKSTGATGTISYCGPEVLRRLPSGEYGNFTTKSDIFSLGMILYFLCFAQLPYSSADILNEDNEDLDQLREEITSWSGLHEERKLRPDLPEQLYTFLRRLLSLDPNERPSAEAILQGIKTGAGFDRISETRPRSAGHMFDDLRNDARISSVDIPPSSTPVRRLSTSLMRAGGPAKLRLGSFQRDRGHTPIPGAGHHHEEDEQALSPGGSLVMRDRLPSPTKLTTVPQLTAPPALTQNLGLRIGFQSFATQRGSKIALLLLKVVSLSSFCTPMAANPIVAYPLLGLAALDILLNGPHLTISMILVAVHLVALFLTAKTNVLCISTMGFWNDV